MCEKKKPDRIKKKIGKSIILVGDFSTFHLGTDRANRRENQ